MRMMKRQFKKQLPGLMKHPKGVERSFTAGLGVGGRPSMAVNDTYIVARFRFIASAYFAPYVHRALWTGEHYPALGSRESRP